MAIKMTGKRGFLVIILNGLKEGEKNGLDSTHVFCSSIEKGSSSLAVADERRVVLLGDQLLPPVVRGRFFNGKTGLLDDAQEVS